jgi:glycosyltransferase involved in cell wall biosynthesis
MARIVCISKYPPLEGGIAARTFWLTRALAERGHEVHVVTDRIDVSKEYTSPPEEECPIPDGVFLNRPITPIPWHIPNDSHRAIDLLNTAIEVINRVGADIIDTGYLIPYGIVGYLASRISGTPFVLRHGGSDIAKFLKNGIWADLLTEAFEKAALVITDPDNVEQIRPMTERGVVAPPYVPVPFAFNSTDRLQHSKPVLAFIGKANYYWRHKGWDRAAEVVKCLGPRFEYVIVSQGLGLVDFQEYLNERSEEEVRYKSFVHPAKIPGLLRSIDGIFSFQIALPFPSFTNIVAEALYCGTTVITDRTESAAYMRLNGVETVNLPGQFLILDPKKPEEAAEETGRYFSSRPVTRHDAIPDSRNYDDYCSENERLLLSAAKL